MALNYPYQQQVFSALRIGAPGVEFQPLYQAQVEGQLYRDQMAREAWDRQQQVLQNEERKKQNEFNRQLQTQQMNLNKQIQAANNEKARLDLQNARESLDIQQKQAERALKMQELDSKKFQAVQDTRASVEKVLGEPLDVYNAKVAKAKDEQEAKAANDRYQEMLRQVDERKQQEAASLQTAKQFAPFMPESMRDSLSNTPFSQWSTALQRMAAENVQRVETAKKLRAQGRDDLADAIETGLELTPTAMTNALGEGGGVGGGNGLGGRNITLSEEDLQAFPENVRPLVRNHPELLKTLASKLDIGGKQAPFLDAFREARMMVDQIPDDQLVDRDGRRVDRMTAAMSTALTLRRLSGNPVSAQEVADFIQKEQVTKPVGPAFNALIGQDVGAKVEATPEVADLVNSATAAIAPLVQRVATEGGTSGGVSKAAADAFQRKLDETIKTFNSQTLPDGSPNPNYRGTIRQRIYERQLALLTGAQMAEPKAKAEAMKIAMRDIGLMSNFLTALSGYARENISMKQRNAAEYDAKRLGKVAFWGAVDGLGPGIAIPDKSKTTPRTSAEKLAYWAGFAGGFAPWVLSGAGLVRGGASALAKLVGAKAAAQIIAKVPWIAKAGEGIAESYAGSHAVTRGGLKLAGGALRRGLETGAAFGLGEAGRNVVGTMSTATGVTTGLLPPGSMMDAPGLDEIAQRSWDQAKVGFTAGLVLPPSAMPLAKQMLYVGGAAAGTAALDFATGKGGSAAEDVKNLILAWGAGTLAHRLSLKSRLNKALNEINYPLIGRKQVLSALSENDPGQFIKLLERIKPTERARVIKFTLNQLQGM